MTREVPRHTAADCIQIGKDVTCSEADAPGWLLMRDARSRRAKDDDTAAGRA